MTHIVADRTPDGWAVVVADGETVRVTTAGNDVRIEVSPDENATPLKVGLEQKGAQ